MAGRRWYEVRVREQIGPNRWVKKSKFYKVKGPGDAARKYKGPGHIMWVNKVQREGLLGVGSFLSLGEELLDEMKEHSGNGRSARRKFHKQKRKALS